VNGSVIIGLQKQPVGNMLVSGANFPAGANHVYYPHINPSTTVQELKIL